MKLHSEKIKNYQTIIKMPFIYIRLRKSLTTLIVTLLLLPKLIFLTDNFEHVQQCPFYYTKWNPAWVNDDENVAKYLVKLNRERMKRFKMPIL